MTQDKYNKMLIDRIKGLPARKASLLDLNDPRNPNVAVVKEDACNTNETLSMTNRRVSDERRAEINALLDQWQNFPLASPQSARADERLRAVAVSTIQDLLADLGDAEKAIRASALEEAAKVAEHFYKNDFNMVPSLQNCIASAIRALKPKEQTND